MSDRGWDMPPTELLQVQLLDWLYDRTVEDPDAPHRLDGFEPKGDQLDWLSISAAARALVERGLLSRVEKSTRRLTERLGPVRLTDSGIQAVEARRLRRSDPVARSRACNAAFLEWMYETRRNGNASPIGTHFLQNRRAIFEGDPFTESDLAEAMGYLKDRGLIQGEGSYGSTLIGRPTLTSDGIDCVQDFDADVRAYVQPKPQSSGGSTYNTNFHGTISGQVAVGESVAQTQHQGIDPDALARLLAEVREAAQSLPDNSPQQVQMYLQIIQMQVDADQPDEEAVRQSVGMIKKIGSKAGNAALSSSATMLLGAIAKMLGWG